MKKVTQIAQKKYTKLREKKSNENRAKSKGGDKWQKLQKITKIDNGTYRQFISVLQESCQQKSRKKKKRTETVNYHLFLPIVKQNKKASH